MMFKSVFLLLLTGWAGLSLYAQPASPPTLIGILPFKVMDRHQLDIAKQVEAIVYEEFVSSRRLGVVEREFFHELENEKWRQSQTDFIDGSVIQKTRALGARYLLIGQITLCEVTRQQTDEGETYYSCDLKVSLRLTDIESSVVQASKTWQNNGLLDFDIGDTKAKAMAKSANSMRRRARNFLDDHFPLRGEILQLMEDESVLIGVGANQGVRKNDRLLVFATRRVAGRRYDEEIGEVKVTAVNGPVICTAKIKKGDEAVIAAIRDQSALYVKTKS